ncbi:TspO and MBR like protein [Haliscomenobacter hydrossis DSM 1100]|uniref:TspO and MBR like protein n=1 Tax=Haliscomenobacter hydrossis (strain ATCC 27775 / DSM 1100 / LMG 10767 / O) TaxID=760192 RepID=F4L6X5_HALH1|nr:TspO and MBR like protein [Haliscomenobacter hydrossis DSM 1100]
MRTQRNASSIWKLIIAVLACEAIGFTSGLIGSAGMNVWFDNLQKPSWNPPAYLFAPVWTLLYALMGIAFWLIWKNETAVAKKRSAYVAFALQLFLNFWWSIIFFKFQSPFFALIEIILLLFMIILTIFHFSKISKTAAWLLVPYLLWVSFASVLNYTIWALNS